MKQLISFLALIFTLPTMSLADGGIVGNGGDVVYCSGPEFHFDGYQSLDFAFAIGTGISKDDFRNVVSWNQSAKDIENILQEVAPHLSPSFKEFVLSVKAQKENLHKAVHRKITWLNDWKSTLTHLIDQTELGNVLELPESCWFNPERPEIMGLLAYRTIVRIKDETNLTFHYDGFRLDKLRKQSPLQFSLLMIHEWIWNLTSKIEINRQITQAIHLKNKNDELHKLLKNLPKN